MLSIIVPLRNEYENLKQIEIEFKNHLRNIIHEVLLINDFSEDGTLDFAKEISKRNSNFITLDNKKKRIRWSY